VINPGDTLVNSVTGEELTFLQTAASTNGEYVEIVAVVQPGGFVAAAHVHPSQSVLERTREIGLLRAVAAPAARCARMVRYEGVLTTLIGATLGLVLGVFLAGLTTAAIAGAQFSVPYVQLLVMCAVAYGLGVIAAVAPARRATRLNVVEALAFE
jgi:hypothetical protein